MTTEQQLQTLFNRPFSMTDYTAFLRDVLKPTSQKKWELLSTPIPLDLPNKGDKGEYLGYMDTMDGYKIGFFRFQMKDPIARRRVGLRQLVKKYTLGVDAALVVFDDGSHWRLSFICDLKNEATAPKRFTFVFGAPKLTDNSKVSNASEVTDDPRCLYRTPVSRFMALQKGVVTFETLRNAFSVEALTKEFYQKLFNWYLWAKDKKTGVTFPNSPDTEKDDRDKIEVKMIRLITRMLFVWFIKQKDLVPDKLFNTKELSDILRDFDPQATNNGNYYNAILQNLFFATLNQEKKHRAFAPNSYQGKNSAYTIKSLYRDSQNQSWFNYDAAEKQQKVMELFQDIPYLNGGLFDCLDKFVLEGGKFIPLFYYDGFSSQDARSKNGNWKYRAFIPNCLFFADEHTEIVTDGGKQQKITTLGLITLFNQYNFTVDENIQGEREVSLSPELLGHVFENLLASYNEETQKSARKSTGSFYTPHDVVNYMVNESIITYLKNKGKQTEHAIRLLVDKGDVTEITDKEETIQDIKSMTILDPACGSGAFPMGFLLKIVDLIELLQPNFNRYETKLEIIKNCIFGVDIQPIAMLICKLRFFISLICDNDKDVSKGNCGIIPLPNLETKFVAANSLLSADVRSFTSGWLNDPKLVQLKEDLLNLRKDVISIHTLEAKRKKIQQDEDKCKEIEEYIIQHSMHPDTNKIAQLEREKKKYEGEYEACKNECWISESVQAELFHSANTTSSRRDINKDKRDKLKSRIEQCEKEIQKEKNKSIPTGFEAAVKQVTTEWNPYNPNKVATFFDSEWMFGVKDGFDIVIGNPPYVSTKETKSEKEQYEKEFGFSDDLYNLFTFKALNSVVRSGKIIQKAAPLITKDGGILTYIMPNTFWATQTKRSMRDLLLGKSINYIFDSANPFESVMVDTCILQVANKPTEEEHTINFLDGREDLKNPMVLNSIKQADYKNTLNAVIFKPTDYNLTVWKKYNQEVKALYDKWWNKIKTSKDIEKNKNELKRYRQSLKPGDIALLGCLTEGGQGLATANNGKYVAVRKGTKWADNVIKSRPKKLREAYNQCEDKEKAEFENLIGNVSPEKFLQNSTEKQIADAFDAIKERFGRDIFGQGYLYKLIDDSELADIASPSGDAKENGIDTSKPYYVPYDKGDKDGNRWYLETPYAIAWSKENVHFLKTNSGKKGEGMPVVRNPQFYFREGFCWIDVSNAFIKARLKDKGIFDVVSMSLYTLTDLPDWYFVCLINSRLIGAYVNSFINNTCHFQINDARQLPIIIPTESQLQQFSRLFNAAVKIKQTTNSQADLDLIQQQLDDLVYNLYDIHPNTSICTNKLKQSKALVYELNGITSYSKLLQIEKDKDSALQLLILIHIHQNPADTETQMIAVIQDAIASLNNPNLKVSNAEIQAAIDALVNDKVIDYTYNKNFTADTPTGLEDYEKVYVWFQYIHRYPSKKNQDENFATRIETIDDFATLQQRLCELNHDTSKNFIYRGVNNAAYMMYSSAQRDWLNKHTTDKSNDKAGYIAYINSLIVGATPIVRPYLLKYNIPDNEIEVLALMQHYESVSPFVDFSTCIYKALFFAFDDAECSKAGGLDDYVALYYVSCNDLKKDLQNLYQEAAEIVQKISEQKSSETDGVNCEKIKGELEKLPLDKIKDLTHIMVSGNTTTHLEIPAVNFVTENTITSMRQMNQNGLFIANLLPNIPLVELINQVGESGHIFHCIHISKKLKDKVLKWLKNNKNIDKQKMYEDKNKGLLKALKDLGKQDI